MPDRQAIDFVCHTSANLTPQKLDEQRDTTDLNLRLKQLSKLILTSQSVNEGAEPSPTKLDFDLSPYQVCLLIDDLLQN